jgi:hypothetical protein
MNMKKLIICLFCVASAGVTVAEGLSPIKVPFNELPKEEQEARIAKAMANRIRRTGGDIEKPNSQRGKILVVNSQKVVPSDGLIKAVEELRKKSRLNIVFSESNEKASVANAESLKKKSGADIVVFITECESGPMILNAIDDGWAIVNVNAVTKEARNDVFKAARVRKEMLRAFYSIAGSMNSNFPNSLMQSIRSPRDLDKVGDIVPVDVHARTIENLKSIGITPTQITSYLQACKLGWAPAPTNDIQKTIWDKVHAAPKNPMKIEFDPKKGR